MKFLKITWFVVIAATCFVGCKFKTLNTSSNAKGYSPSELRNSPAVWQKAKEAVCSLEKAGWKKIDKSFLPRWNGRTLTHGEMVQVMACFANFESTMGADTVAAATDGMGRPLGYWQVKEEHAFTTCRSLEPSITNPSKRLELLQFNRDFNAACSLLVFKARSPGRGFDPWANFCEPSDAVLKKPNGDFVFPQSCDDCAEDQVGWRIEVASSTSLRVKVSVPKACSANEAVARWLKKVSDKEVISGDAVIANFSQMEGERRVAFINVPVDKIKAFTHLRITAKKNGTEFFRTNPSPSLEKYLVDAQNSTAPGATKTNPNNNSVDPVGNPVSGPDALPEPQNVPSETTLPPVQSGPDDYFGQEFN